MQSIYHLPFFPSAGFWQQEDWGTGTIQQPYPVFRATCLTRRSFLDIPPPPPGLHNIRAAPSVTGVAPPTTWERSVPHGQSTDKCSAESNQSSQSPVVSPLDLSLRPRKPKRRTVKTGLCAWRTFLLARGLLRSPVFTALSNGYRFRPWTIAAKRRRRSAPSPREDTGSDPGRPDALVLPVFAWVYSKYPIPTVHGDACQVMCSCPAVTKAPASERLVPRRRTMAAHRSEVARIGQRQRANDPAGFNKIHRLSQPRAGR